MTGFGNKLAGLLGESAESMGEFAIFTGIVALKYLEVLFYCLEKLEVLTHGVEEVEA